MNVGIFHPVLNHCGGAEWVAINIINALKGEGHKTITLTNEIIDQKKITNLFGYNVNVDTEVIFPLEIFPPTDLHNVYTDAIRTMFFKSKCDIIIDTHSNTILPGVNITYIHYPLLGRLNYENVMTFKKYFFLPYGIYERKTVADKKRVIISNSKYTANSINKITGKNPVVLYPPISNKFYIDLDDDVEERENIVVSVSRISPEKRLTMIPYMAKLTKNNIRFLVIGIKQSEHTLMNILELINKYDVSDRVEVMTNVSSHKLEKILKKSKVFFHPASGEHFGVSIAEAMAAGCLPVVHDSGGPREFVPEKYRFQGASDAAQKIEMAVSDWSPHQMENIVSRAHNFREDIFSTMFLKIFYSYVSMNPLTCSHNHIIG